MVACTWGVETAWSPGCSAPRPIIGFAASPAIQLSVTAIGCMSPGESAPSLTDRAVASIPMRWVPDPRCCHTALSTQGLSAGVYEVCSYRRPAWASFSTCWAGSWLLVAGHCRHFPATMAMRLFRRGSQRTKGGTGPTRQALEKRRTSLSARNGSATTANETFPCG